MALIRQTLDQFTDVSIKSVMQQQAYDGFKTTLARATRINPFALPSASADALERFGIATSPFAARLHTHAAAKAVENRLLEIVGALLPKEPVTFYFLKPQKRDPMRRNPRIGDFFHNQIIEPRDVARYEPSTLRESITAPTTSVVYISDSLHFLPFHFLVSLFAHNPVVQTVHATVVLPPEALHKHPSQNPHIYSINYDFDGFQYIPGTHGGGAYHHEFKQLDWLKVGKLKHVLADGTTQTITCQMVESLGANHLFTFCRGDLITPRVRTFSADQYVILPKLFHPKQLNVTRPLHSTFANQLLTYVLSLKTVTLTDVFAKIRQLIPTSELHRYQPEDVVHIANFFYFASQRPKLCNYDQIVDDSLFNSDWRWLKSHIRYLWEEVFGQSDFKKLLKTLDWTPFTYSLEVEEHFVQSPVMFRTTPFHNLRDDVWNLSDAGPTLDDAPCEAPDAPAPTTPPAHSSAQDGPPSTSHPTLDPETFPWSACAPLLNACGFRGDELQYEVSGLLIEPIRHVQSLPRLDEALLPLAPCLIAKLREMRREPVMFTFDRKRATAYGSDVKNSRIGALLRNQTLEWKTTFSAKCEEIERTISLTVIHGAGGSGKSAFLQQWLRDQGKGNGTVSLCLPTVELRSDWMRKVPELHSREFRTFEKALVQPSSRVVIMDDHTKFPAGYIEAFVAMHPETQALILTGDPKQSAYHEDNDQACIAHLEPASDALGAACRYYLNATHRNRRDLANKLGVYSEVDGVTRITHSAIPMQGWPILAPSHAKKLCLSELGNRAYSYAGCQGLTTPSVQILLDSNTPLCSDAVLYTALSRARDAIHFLNTGPTSSDFWAKLDSTPYLKAFLRVDKEEPAPEPVAREPEAAPVPPPRTHFPVEPKTTLLEPMIAELTDKYEREMHDSRHGHTNCIQTEDLTVQLFQHQQARDEALLFKTIEKRIALSTPRDNEKELLLKKDIGDILFLNYQRAMKLPADPIPFSEELWDSCEREVQHRFLSKPVSAIINGRDRQSPDFDEHKVALFLKSQWVKKTEKIGRLDVTAGQTIASFMQQTVMLFGAMARYMRRIRMIYQPDNIFITCENTPDDLNEWVLERWNFDGRAHSNDFTAFDQSQDGAMLQFGVIKAKHHNIPESILDAYIAIKTHAHIFLGTLTIMRLSGEGPTFDANTECAIAYHHTKYDVGPEVSQLYAGDDMAQDRPPVEKPSFQLLAGRLKLTSKEVSHKQIPGDFATFCGWNITPKGIMKDPMKLYASLQLAKSLGNTKEVKTAYAHDLHYAYRMGDELQEVLDERGACLHQATTRELTIMGCSEILNSF
ncbi:replicase [Mint virus X]|uniref:RNA replication protein n=1 Tax=Mint virus X TaxID=301865 RepID=Q5G7H3_9VIRU|nr:replicase [Mint virus X]AAW67746.1 replicase [Mint virus X]